MLTGIFLFGGRREQIIFRIIIDHGFGQDLVSRMAPGLFQVLFHKRGHLIHIEVNIRDILRTDIIQTGKSIKNAFQHVRCIDCHRVHLRFLFHKPIIWFLKPDVKSFFEFCWKVDDRTAVLRYNKRWQKSSGQKEVRS